VSEDFSICMKMVAPEAIRQHYRLLRVREFLPRSERSAKFGRNAKRGEKVERDPLVTDFGRFRATQQERFVTDCLRCGQLRENLVPAAPNHVIG
jgi:hypothetical protein